MSKQIPWLRFWIACCLAVAGASSAVELNGAAGNIFKVDSSQRSFELLKETEYAPKTDIGQSRFTVYWSDDTKVIQVEQRENFDGVNGPVHVTFQGIDASNVKALREKRAFEARVATVRIGDTKFEGVDASLQKVDGLFTPSPGPSSRGGSIRIGDEDIAVSLRKNNSQLFVRTPIRAVDLATGFWKTTIQGKEINGRFVVDTMEVTKLEDPRKTDDPKLPRVLVIGDSISMNYHESAKQALKGIANYHRNEGNAASSTQGVRNLELWLGDYQEKGFHWDVIQFNHGLHDLKQIYDAKTDTFGEYSVPLEDYKKNLEKEIAILQKTGAKLIWCSTTPVPNHNKGQYARRKGAEKEFNEAAREVMKRHPEILINDLAQVVNQSPVFDKWRTTRDVHFYQKEEQKALGDAVAKAVRNALDSTTSLFDDTLTLPIRFHITTGAAMTLKGQGMGMWVTPEDLNGPVLAEINRIWKPANIQFTVERAQQEALRQPDNFAQICESIAAFKRGDEKRLGSQRTDNIGKLLDPAHRHPTALNVYLLPFIGSTYQGYANLGGNHAVVGVWTDKASNGKNPPVKTLLVEPEPMKVGSLARTIAHEIGHNLTLQHPDKSLILEVGRLMGGRKHGYALTPEDVTQARASARKHLKAAAKR
jgi:acyl-CoA thioesterase-1